MSVYRVIGLMSGTSLDGLDMACCRLERNYSGWNYKISDAVTINYDDFMTEFLSDTKKYSGTELEQRNIFFGNFIGMEVIKFLKINGFKADLLASHGHTIFHQPEKGITYQLGDGRTIATVTGITTISDFRILDIMNGGQGAPLVPVGDELLFAEFDYCLNLGGFSNISYRYNNSRVAFDICPVNIFLNHVCRKIGKDYDNNGMLASRGSLISILLDKLNDLNYYHLRFPKSLSREWFETIFLPVVDKFDYPAEDILRTACEHIAVQIAGVLGMKPGRRVLLSGGGVYNTFLIKLISEKTKAILETPDDKLIKFKEALVFALLGVLKFRNEVNCYSSVTGAKYNSSCGTIYLPDQKRKG